MAGPDAAGANLNAPDGAVADSLDLLQIRIPDPAGFVVGVADIVAEARAFTTYFTYLGHCYNLRIN